MTGFILGALALTAVALAFVLPPLWQKARKLAIVVTLALPLAAIGLYLHAGAPDALSPQPHSAAAPTSFDDALTALRARLAQTPDDLEGWLLLGRTLRFQEDFEASRDALRRAHELAPEQPDLMVDYAESMVLARQDRRIGGEPLALIERALALDPTQQRALLLLGAHQIQTGQPAEGAATWEKLLDLAPVDALPALRERIDAVRAEAGLPPLPAQSREAEGEPTITLDVDIDPALAASVPPGAALFVLARAIDGPPMPFAAKRLPIGGFPRSVTLGNADSPMPSARLFDQKQVRLVARISLQGVANAQPGDLEGTVDAGVEPGARIALRIDRVVE